MLSTAKKKLERERVVQFLFSIFSQYYTFFLEKEGRKATKEVK